MSRHTTYVITTYVISTNEKKPLIGVGYRQSTHLSRKNLRKTRLDSVLQHYISIPPIFPTSFRFFRVLSVYWGPPISCCFLVCGNIFLFVTTIGLTYYTKLRISYSLLRLRRPRSLTARLYRLSVQQWTNLHLTNTVTVEKVSQNRDLARNLMKIVELSTCKSVCPSIITEQNIELEDPWTRCMLKWFTLCSANHFQMWVHVRFGVNM